MGENHEIPLRYFGTISIRTLRIQWTRSFSRENPGTWPNSWFLYSAGTIKIFWKPKNHEKSWQKADKTTIRSEINSEDNKDHFNIHIIWPYWPILVHISVPKMILDQPEVISWPSCDRPSLQTVNSFPKKWTHREPIPEVRFQLSSPREGETGSQFRRSYAKTDHLHESDCMTHDSFFDSFKEVTWKIQSTEYFRWHFRSLEHFRFVYHLRNIEWEFSIFATWWRQNFHFLTSPPCSGSRN